MNSPRWTEITPSEYAWEREALDYVKARLPDNEPFRAWSNFEFIAEDGSINEVDLLVISVHKVYLVEIMSRTTPSLTGDDEGDVYLAPETTHGQFIAEKLDIFSLGAIGYRLFSGQPPASTVAALNARLESAGGLRLSDAVDGLPGSLQLVVESATDPEVGKRPNSVSEFLDLLVEAERELADLREEQEAVVHPLDANPSDMLEHGFLMEQRLGKGSTAVALKVEHDEGSGVLKVALNPSRFNHAPLPSGASSTSTFRVAMWRHGTSSTNLRCFG